VNKNVNTGANEVPIEPGVHKLQLANYQTGGYKFRPMSGWNGTIGSQPFVYECTRSSVTTKLGHGGSTVSRPGSENSSSRFFSIFFCGAFFG